MGEFRRMAQNLQVPSLGLLGISCQPGNIILEHGFWESLTFSHVGKKTRTHTHSAENTYILCKSTKVYPAHFRFL